MEEKLDYNEFLERCKNLFDNLDSFGFEDKIELINRARMIISEKSPFKSEPVDCIQWVKQDVVGANDYNPNAVAPPEMELLKLSIEADGFTQPIVTWSKPDFFEVVDGFHRSKIGKTYKNINDRLYGYLPVVVIKEDREGRNDRIASTIRHNRARGKHKIESMTDIVVELKRRNWSPKKIGYELGMDQDEVLRLSQISGLAEMFADEEFSKAWEADILDEENIVSDYEALD